MEVQEVIKQFTELGFVLDIDTPSDMIKEDYTISVEEVSSSQLRIEWYHLDLEDYYYHGIIKPIPFTTAKEVFEKMQYEYERLNNGQLTLDERQLYDINDLMDEAFFDEGEDW